MRECQRLVYGMVLGGLGGAGFSRGCENSGAVGKNLAAHMCVGMRCS